MLDFIYEYYYLIEFRYYKVLNFLGIYLLQLFCCYKQPAVEILFGWRQCNTPFVLFFVVYGIDSSELHYLHQNNLTCCHNLKKHFGKIRVFSSRQFSRNYRLVEEHKSITNYLHNNHMRKVSLFF